MFFTLTLGDSYFPFLAYSCFPITTFFFRYTRHYKNTFFLAFFLGLMLISRHCSSFDRISLFSRFFFSLQQSFIPFWYTGDRFRKRNIMPSKAHYKLWGGCVRKWQKCREGLSRGSEVLSQGHPITGSWVISPN